MGMELLVPIGTALALVAFLFIMYGVLASLYRKVPPNRALIVYGLHGVHIVPAFGGLAAPWWKDTVRGIITGVEQLSVQLEFDGYARSYPLGQVMAITLPDRSRGLILQLFRQTGLRGIMDYGAGAATAADQLAG